MDIIGQKNNVLSNSPFVHLLAPLFSAFSRFYLPNEKYPSYRGNRTLRFTAKLLQARIGFIVVGRPRGNCNVEAALSITKIYLHFGLGQVFCLSWTNLLSIPTKENSDSNYIIESIY